MRLTKANIIELATNLGYYAYLFWRRLKVRMLSKSNKPCPYLEFAYFILTWRCNLGCEMCPQRGRAGIFKDEQSTSLKEVEMDVDAWKSTVDKIKKYNPVIQLFGGEPLLYKGGMELIRYIKSSGLRCHMVSNGTLLHSLAEEIVDSGLDNIWISLDGPEDVHNRIRNGNDIYKRIIKGIKTVTELKKKRNTIYPKISILCTIMDQNYLQLNNLLEAVSDLELDKIVLSHIIFINKNQFNNQNHFLTKNFNVISKEWSGYVIDTTNIDVEKLIDELNSIKSKKLNNVYFYPEMGDGMIRKYYANKSFSLDKKCYAPWLTAQFHPDGSLAICSDFKIGSINGLNFDELWNNEISQKFRFLLNKKKLPICDRCCMIQRHSLFRE